MTTHDILVAARKRIENPKRWTTVFWFRDSLGNEVANGMGVYSCCAEGAIMLQGKWKETRRAEDKLREVCGGNIALFNDTHTHAEVLAAFDKAIAATTP